MTFESEKERKREASLELNPVTAAVCIPSALAKRCLLQPALDGPRRSRVGETV